MPDQQLFGSVGGIMQVVGTKKVLDSLREVARRVPLVDKLSVDHLDGTTIDFVDTIEKQVFTIDNPNASGGCACGDSFH